MRGQGYYTGMVFEVTCPQFSGAVASGVRYDNMVGKFIGPQVPAVGFSAAFADNDELKPLGRKAE